MDLVSVNANTSLPLRISVVVEFISVPKPRLFKCFPFHKTCHFFADHVCTFHTLYLTHLPFIKQMLMNYLDSPAAIRDGIRELLQNALRYQWEAWENLFYLYCLQKHVHLCLVTCLGVLFLTFLILTFKTKSTLFVA